MKPQSIISIALLFLTSSLFTACQGDPEQKNSNQSTENTNISESASKENTLQKPGSVQPLSQLDILQDYDRDLWSGPDAWTEEQWRWKKLLKWDRNCDYIGDVETYDINSKLQLVTVQCVPGAYQATYYVFLFDKGTNENRQLNLGLPYSTDNPQEVFGTITYDKETHQMSILTLSRGFGDCGSYRIFKFADSNNLNTEVLQQTEHRFQQCNDHDIDSVEELPKSVFDYKNWPLTK